MRDANTAACVLKREQAAMRGRERRRRRPRRPRWQFTWTHQRCDPCQLAQHALPQHVQPLGAAPRALGSLPDSSGPSSRARALDLPAPTGHRPWSLPASFDRPRAQAAGASARVVSTPCVCAVGTRTDGRALWGRPLRGGTPCHRKWPRPQTDGLKAQIEWPRIIKLPQN